ncbi:hypothetical protein [Fortiea contorta]|uniref:hypothetical protein n=1 Tax=Fortiea contorta TaxID=1892405 RepID=UPI001EE66F18|nr:hypothetical protein [Fortiea contorta]
MPNFSGYKRLVISERWCVGRWGDGEVWEVWGVWEVGRWGDGEVGRWGDGD